MNIAQYNRLAWDREVEMQNRWTVPVTSEEVEAAKNGNVRIYLTPTKPVPAEWLSDLKEKRVLCLASGGGQQGPILAAAGAQVEVFDNSMKQLDKDRMVAERDGLSLTTRLGDMKDLSCYFDDSFDLIVHPVSNCFIDDIQPVWDACWRILRKNGALLSGFTNPLVYLFDFEEQTKSQELIVANVIPYSDCAVMNREQLKEWMERRLPLEFGHTLEAQIGGQLQAGFTLTGFYDDLSGNDNVLDRYIQSFHATRAVK